MAKSKSLTKAAGSSSPSTNKSNVINDPRNNKLSTTTNPATPKNEALIKSTKSYFDKMEDIPKEMTMSKLLRITILFCVLTKLIRISLEEFNPKEYINPCSFKDVLPAYKIRDFKQEMVNIKKEMFNIKSEHDPKLPYPHSIQQNLADLTVTYNNIKAQHDYQKQNYLICFQANIISQYLIKPWIFFGGFLIMVIALYVLFAYYWYKSQQGNLYNIQITSWKSTTMLGLSVAVLLGLLYQLACDLSLSKYIAEFPY